MLLDRDGGGARGEVPLSLQVRNAGEYKEKKEKERIMIKSRSTQGTHGCIHGRTYSKKNKTFPTVQVKDPLKMMQVSKVLMTH